MLSDSIISIRWKRRYIVIIVIHYILLLNIPVMVFDCCLIHINYLSSISCSRMLPKMIAAILSDSLKRERVLLQCDASDVLRDAFSQTEASMNHHYEVFPLPGSCCSFL